MIRHLRQPSKTSCGPTCVAMLAGVTAEDVINLLVSSRKKRTHSTSVAELRNLLAQHNLRLGDRAPYRGTLTRALIKWHRRTPAGQYRRGWHWVVVSGSWVFDPAESGPEYHADWFAKTASDKLHFYEVTSCST